MKTVLVPLFPCLSPGVHGGSNETQKPAIPLRPELCGCAGLSGDSCERRGAFLGPSHFHDAFTPDDGKHHGGAPFVVCAVKIDANRGAVWLAVGDYLINVCPSGEGNGVGRGALDGRVLDGRSHAPMIRGDGCRGNGRGLPDNEMPWGRDSDSGENR